MTYRSLKQALDSMAPEQKHLPTWEDILDRAGGEVALPARNRRRKRSWILAIAALIVVLVPLAAIASEENWWFLREEGMAPKPATDVVVVKSGTWNGYDWKLVAYVSRTGDICSGIQLATGGGGLACGPIPAVLGSPEPSGTRSAGMSSLAGSLGALREDTPYIEGPVVDKAAQVDIYLSDDQVLHVPTIEAPNELGVPVRFFAAELPNYNDWSKLVGLDEEGKIVACLSVVYADLPVCK
ncbi:MAG TPA: hypothetical protein VII83_06640 [Gaiellaceae bacterium]|jgi:hypothetical protein